MASRDGEGSPPDAINEDEQQQQHHATQPDQPENGESVSESGSSYAGTASAGPSTPVCPYRDSRFHDQECSRFFDCPTHQIERAQSDDGEEDEAHEVDEEDDERHESQEQLPVEHESSHVPEDVPSHSQTQEPVEATTSSLLTDPAMINQTPLETQDAGPSDLPTTESNIVQETAAEGDAQAEAGLENAAPGTTTTLPGSYEPAADNVATTESGVASLTLGDWTRPPSRRPYGPTFLDDPQLTFSEYARMQRQSAASGSSSNEPPWLQRSSAADVVEVPRWQPDAEVTSCPICQRDFGLFNRKHHCRKCGRVVCSSCSPHRITIPKEYIVRPPWEQPNLYPIAGEYGAERPLVDFNPYIEGGERVRLCNPCVPDPNVTPPQPAQRLSSRLPPDLEREMSRHQRSRSNVSQSPLIQQLPPGLGSVIGPFRSRSATVNHLPSQTSGGYYGRFGPASISRSYQRNPFTVAHDDESGSSRRHSLIHHRDPHTPPQHTRARSPSIAEEDRCPICHRALPPNGMDDSERLREEHVAACIQEHSSSRREQSSSSPFPPTGTPPRPRRPTGLVSYIADEKERARNEECGICFEDYEPGVKMARLECWCRFHYDCIIEWFQRRGNARCPVHQHDSYGET